MALVLLVLIPASFAGPHIPLSSSFSVNLTTRNFGLQFLHAAKDHFNDPSHATFTLTNGSQLWYSLNINSAPAGLKVTTADPVNDIVGTAFFSSPYKLLQPSDVIPVNIDGTLYQNLHLAAAFTAPNQQIQITLNPFTIPAGALDIGGFLLDFLGQQEEEGLLQPGVIKQVVDTINTSKDLIQFVNDYISTMYTILTGGNGIAKMAAWLNELLMIQKDKNLGNLLGKVLILMAGANVVNTAELLKAWLEAPFGVVALTNALIQYLLALGGYLVNYSKNQYPTVVLQSFQGKAPNPTNTPVPTGTALTPQTSCPNARTARPAVFSPLKLGTDPNIVYAINSPYGKPLSATLQRYDVTTRQTTTIVQLANTYITDAQVSGDGQWILFLAQTDQYYAIQLIRLDGQDLQTLYCAPASIQVAGVLWSPNEAYIVFNLTNPFAFYLLNVATGLLQDKSSLLPPVDNSSPFSDSYTALTWLDDSRLYMTKLLGVPGNPYPPNGVYLLDFSQQSNNFQEVANIPSETLWSMDKSADGTKLFISHCGGCGQEIFTGPSTITVQSMPGGTPTLLHSSQRAITEIAVVSDSSLLFQVSNTSPDNSVDTSQNGLWKINTDGTGLTRLTTDGAEERTELRTNFLDFPNYGFVQWSTISRDGIMYAVAQYNFQNNSTFLLVGNVNGNSQPLTVPGSGNVSEIAGWTTM